MPRRVVADIALLERYAAEVEGAERRRWWALDDAVAQLGRFFSSGSVFGPAGSGVPALVAAWLEDTAIDGLGVLATAAAFAEADVLRSHGAGIGWAPDDGWIERRRRAWLTAHHPGAIEAASPLIDPLDAVARLGQIDAMLAQARASGFPSPMAVEAWLEERAALRAEAVVMVDAFTDAIDAWSGSDNDPLLDRLVGGRQDMIDLLAERDALVAERMTALVNSGTGAGLSFTAAARESALETRVAEVMAADDVDRASALQLIAAMDARIAEIIGTGYTAEEAVTAFAIAQRADLDLDRAMALAESRTMSLLDVLGTLAVAGGLDMSFDEVRAYEAFSQYFDVFDNATGGNTDGAVSVRDLLHVVDHPGEFTTAQVLAAQAILDEPVLRNRLDTASDNGDILDGDSFGGTNPGDGVVSVADLNAFMAGTYLNNLLGEYSVDIDTAAEGGTADGFFSEGDLRAWLDDPATADLPVEVRDGVQSMLDGRLFDEGWWDRNRDALAMGTAVIAGGALIVLTAGTATPVAVAMSAGFAAGGVAAGGTTLAVNHFTGAELRDGLLGNSLNGGMIGMSVAGLPVAFSEAATITGGLTLRNGVAASTLTSEVTGIVGTGGVDLLVPDRWESDLHRVADATSVVAGVPGILYDGADAVIRRWGTVGDDGVRVADAVAIAVRAPDDDLGRLLDTYEFDHLSNPGPLAGHARNPMGNFYAGRYRIDIVDRPTIVYRAGAADGYPTGSWYTADPVESVAQARLDLALRPQWIDPQTGVLTGSSPVDSVYAVQLPAGTTVYRGPVGSRGGAYVGNPNVEQLFIENTHRVGDVVGRIDIGEAVSLLPVTPNATAEPILGDVMGGTR